MPLAQSAATLPGVSAPSRVVRSIIRIASARAQTFDAFLIERLPSDAARSSTPTWSTVRTPPIRDPRCTSEVTAAIGQQRLLSRIRRKRYGLAAHRLEAVRAGDGPATGGEEGLLRRRAAVGADHVGRLPRATLPAPVAGSSCLAAVVAA